MSKFKEKLGRFFYGRYGIDALNKFMIYFILGLLVFSLFFGIVFPESVFIFLATSILPMVVFFFYFFRMLSKNHAKRRKELLAYQNITATIKRTLTGNTSKSSKSKNTDTDVHIFRDCTKCKATLRLPKNKGKHSVKCPKCGWSFKVKSK